MTIHVSLDYLMRGTEEVAGVSGQAPEKYTSEKMWVMWNTFTTNLTGMQKVMFTLGYMMAVAFMAVIVGTAVYELAMISDDFSEKSFIDVGGATATLSLHSCNPVFVGIWEKVGYYRLIK